MTSSGSAKNLRDSRRKAPVGSAHAQRAPIVTAIAAALLALLPIGKSNAEPTGAQVTEGAATFQSSDASLTIDQSTPRAAINWQSFDIAPHETVRFNQPDASSIALNRVLGQDASHIQGTLAANGQVFILNPNGVLFGVGANVNVGGLVASTLAMSDRDFMAGHHALTQGAVAGAVVNEAAIVAAEGGYVALIAPQVSNAGSIDAPDGTVALAAGGNVTLTLSNGSLLGLAIEHGTLDALVENKQAIHATGGLVILTAKAMDQVTRSVVNNTGVIEAGALTAENGVIRLEASTVSNAGTIAASTIGIDATNDITLAAGSTLRASAAQAGEITVHSATGTTLAAGAIEARSSAGIGGAIELLGNFVGVTGTARIDASGQSGGGSVLIGGDYQGGNPAVQNAYRTYVGPDVAISADAVEHGDGGTVVVWADDFTRFGGAVSARGGAQSGDGGLVETSGKINLEMLEGRVDTHAPNGAAGTWLLDPSDVDITTSASTSTMNGEIFTPNVNTAVVNAGQLSSALATGNVTVTTDSGGAQAGTVTVSAPITRSAGTGTTTLTLLPNQVSAGGTLTVSAAGPISGSIGHPLNVNLHAKGVGATMAIGAPINTFGGNFSSTGTTFTNAGGPITTAGGNIDISQTTTITLPNPLSSGGGNIAVAGGSTFTYASTMDAGSGTVTIQGSADTLALGVGSTAGTFNITQAQIATISTTGGLIFGRVTGTTAIHIATTDVLDFGTKDVTFRQAAGGITVEGAIVTGAILGSGTVNFIGGTGTFTSNQTINTTGAVNIKADHIAINANILGSGKLTISPYTATIPIQVGRVSPSQVDFASSFTTNSVTSKARTIQIGDVANSGGLTVAGPYNPAFPTLYLVTGGTLAIPSGASTVTAPNVIMASSTFNNSGAASIVTPGGRWLAYSTSPTGSTEGGLTTAAAGSTLPRLYNRTYAANGPATITEPGNHLIYSAQPTLTITSDPKSRLYGDTNPAFTYTRSGFVVDDGVTDTVATAGLSGEPSLSTVASVTSNVGGYPIVPVVATLASAASYALAFTNGTLTVNQRPITVTADGKTRIYGDLNPAFTDQVTVGNLVNGDPLSGIETTVASGASGVGNYPITLGTRTAGSNYLTTFVDGNLAVTQRPLTVTADGQTRIYGDSNPALGYQISAGNLVNGDGFAGILSTTAAVASNVNAYPIVQNTLTAGGNYALTFVNGSLGITQRPIGITGDSYSRLYGDANPTLTYQLTAGDLVNGNLLSGSVATMASVASGVGAIPITQGTVTAGSNYALTYVDGTLTITQQPIGVTADNQSRHYGSDNPALGYLLTSGALKNGDALSGFATTAADGTSSVGNYAIGQGAVTAGANYLLTFVDGTLSVAQRPLTVTANSNSRIYGNANPTLNYQITAGDLVNGDALTGNVSTAAALASNVGGYAIGQNTLSATGNYALTFVDGTLTVTQRPIQVTADGKTRAYGDPNPALTHQLTAGTLVNSDTLSGSAATAETTASGFGAYAIGQGTIAATANYALTFVDGTLTITKRPIAVTADAKSRAYGDGNPTLTQQVTSGTLISSDVLTGTATTAADGTSIVGNYAIGQGTVTAGANYLLTFIDGALAVTQRPITVTADGKSRVYGDANPTLTHQLTGGSLVNGDTLTGITTTSANGSNVGNYAIERGTVSAGSNYNLSFVDGSLAVTQRPITVTAASLARAYGAANPALPYLLTGGTLVDGDTLSGSAATAADGTSIVGNYSIGQGAVSAGTNYALTFVAGDLAVTQRPITVTANDLSRDYGDANPVLTYLLTGGSLVNGDVLTGVVTTAATTASAVGDHLIEQGTVAASSNYLLTFVDGTLEITQRPIEVTANDLSRAYGDGNPALLYQITEGDLVNDDVLSGSLITTATVTSGVGDYAIEQNTLSATGNYALTFVDGALTVTQRAIQVTADGKTRAYGDPNPTLTQQLTGGSLVNSDAFSGAVSTTANDSNVGNYPIAQGTLTAGANYSLTFIDGNLAITQRPITVTGGSLSRAYGDSNPALTYLLTGGSLVYSDTLSGSATAAADGTSIVGNYAIGQGTVSAGTNYALTFVDGNLAVTQRPLQVTAAGKTRVYGESNPALTYAISAGSLVNDDLLVGAVTTAATAASAVGNHPIERGTVAATSNYLLTFIDGALAITQRPIEVTADDRSRIYGAANPALEYQITEGDLVNGDGFSGTLSTAATVASGVGGYAIEQSTLSAGGNYALTFVDGALTITQRPIQVTADGKTRAYGDPNPALTQQITAGSLVNSDAFSGAVTTSAIGSNVGNYPIAQGTLSAGANYLLTFVDGNMAVTQRPITVTANDLSREYGEPNPALTYLLTGGSLVYSDTLSGNATTAADGTSGVGNYAIGQGTVSAGTNYLLTFVDGALAVAQRPLEVTVDDQSRAYGEADPAFPSVIIAGSLVNGDVLTGSAASAQTAASGIGTYAIGQGTIAATANYALTFLDGVLTITKRPIGVTADAKTRAYGDSNPTLTRQVTAGSLVNGDALSGSPATAADGTSSVGSYAIGQGAVTAGANYLLTFVDGSLTVTQRPIQVTADGKSRAYGDSNPVLTQQLTGGTFVNGDALTGTATTAANGSNVGSYAIERGTISAGANYLLTFVDGTIAVTQRPITVTANDLSRAYGDGNPALTYLLTSGSLVHSDTLAGLATTAADGTSSVGNYAIGQGLITAGSNYLLTFVDGNLAVTQRPIEVTADDQSRAYGDLDPTFTSVLTAGSLVNGDSLTGDATTAADGTSGIGDYAIGQGTIAADANYALTFVDGNLSITKRPIAVTADAKTRVYGESNPPLTQQVTTGTLVNGNVLSGTAATAADGTSSVGSYAIGQGTVSAGDNYLLTFVDGSLTVTQRPIQVTADGKSRFYGEPNPTLTHQLTGGTVVNGDLVSGTAATSANGSNVGSYAIGQGTVGAGGNYLLTFVDGSIAVTQRPITVTATDLSREYGDPNPALPYLLTGGSLVHSDTLSGTATTAATSASSVGNFAIEHGTVTAGANYLLTFVPGNLAVTPRAIEVTATGDTRVYGDSNPTLAYAITHGDLVNGDAFSGGVTTAAAVTSSVGNYPIVQSTLLASSNYTLSFVGNDLTVTQRPLEVTADDQNRDYGDPNLPLTYQLIAGDLVNGDAFTGVLSTAATAASDVGGYLIERNTLSAGGNYALTFNNGTLIVGPLDVTLIVEADNQSRAYGDANPELTYDLLAGALEDGDTITGTATTMADTTSSVGSYPIEQGTITAGSNYNLSFVNGSLTVTQRPIGVTAADGSRLYGDPNPAFPYQLTTGSLVNGDLLTGTATTTANGSNVDSYLIQQGTVTAGANYLISFTNGNLAVTQRPITVTADDSSQVYGNGHSPFTYQLTGGTLIGSDTLAGSASTLATVASGIGDYAISQGTVTAGANYSLSFVAGNLAVTQRPIAVTADAKSRAYGDSNPALTQQVTLGSLYNGDALSGSLTTAADTGSAVGNYAIEQGTVAASANYLLDFGDGNLSVTQRLIGITADSPTRAYGDVDPALTYQTTAGSLVNGDSFSGTLKTAAVVTSDVGSYLIQQDTVSAGSNYSLSVTDGSLTVAQRPIAVTATSDSRLYGEPNPALAYLLTGGTLVNGDALSGSPMTTANGSDVGSYLIERGTVTAGANYDLSFTNGNLAVTQRPITVTADANSQVYGNAHSPLTYQLTAGNLINTDVLTGSLSTLATEVSNVGNYAIERGTVTGGGNYSLTFVDGAMTVTQRPIAVTADAKSRAYGDSNPALTHQVTLGNLYNDDALSGGATTAADGTSSVGNYAIERGTIAASSNYLLTFVDGSLAVTQRPLAITANDLNRIYGDANPTLTYQTTTGSLVNGDSFSGVLKTAADVTSGVGGYLIQQDTVSAGSNYSLSVTDGNLDITQRPITVAATSDSRIYGDPNPVLAFQLTGGSLVNSDVLSGNVTTTANGSNVGSYPIQRGTVTAGDNYSLTFTNGSLSVTQRPITVTADDHSQVYGNAHAPLTYQLTSGNLIGADVLTGSVSTLETIASNVGNYAIEHGTVTAGANYNMSFVDGNMTVTQRPIAVTANAQTKIYGQANPTLTHQVTLGSLYNGDALTGTATTAADGTSSVGNYAIERGTIAASANYLLTFVDGNLSITQRALAIAADNLSRIYGDANPTLTYRISAGSLINGDSFSGDLKTAATVASGVGGYLIQQDTMSAGANYSLSVADGNLSVTRRPIAVTATSDTRIYGDSNPALSIQLTGGSLVNGDALGGAPMTTATATSNVGAHPISQGTVGAGANYLLTFTDGALNITQRPITVTADDNSQVYGNAHSPLTYQVTIGDLTNGDLLTGSVTSLATAASNVGNYAIGRGTVAASSNYSLSFIDGNLAVTQRPIGVTAAAQSRIYGDTNPTLTHVVTSGSLYAGDTLSGSTTTAADTASAVGSYAIERGTVAASANYLLTFSDGSLTVAQRSLGITADSLTRVYGEANPTLTYQLIAGDLVNGDTFTGTLKTAATLASGVGGYLIQQDTVTAGGNYALSVADGNLSITRRPLAVTATSASRLYGEPNPTLAYQLTGGSLVNGDALSGSLMTIAGESNVGSYSIQRGTLSAGANYNLSFTNGNLAVTQRPITVTADNGSQVYGNAHSPLTYQPTAGHLVYADVLTGSVSTLATATSGVGNYAIERGTVAASANYDLSFIDGNMTVTQRPISITANGQSRAYGDANPALTTQVTSGSLYNGDSLSGSAMTAADGTSIVGSYAIERGTIAASANYLISNFTDGILSVTQRPITVTANSGSRVYGDVNPALTYQLTGGSLVNGDSLTGAASTAATLISNVGAHAIGQGTVTANANYALTFADGTLNVTQRPLQVTAVDDSQIYGNSHSPLTYQLTGGNLVNGDMLSGTPSTVATVASAVGGYAIQQGLVTAGGNYALSFIDGLTTVTQRSIAVTANDLVRAYGDANPTLTQQVTSGSLVNGDTLTGSAATAADGTSVVGNYAIQQGTVTGSGNYVLAFNPGTLSVAQRGIAVTADDVTRPYGDVNPALTYRVTTGSLVNADVLLGSPSTSAGVTANAGLYPIGQGTVAASSNYALSFIDGNLLVAQRPIQVTADDQSRAYGDDNSALSYRLSAGSLVNGDALSGSAATTATAASNVGNYGIAQQSVTAGDNYALTFVAGNLLVMPRPLGVSASDYSRSYGDANPAFTHAVISGALVNGDALAGTAATTATPSSDVGSYAIGRGGVTAGNNYALAFDAGTLTIRQRPITITANPQSSVYGDVDPIFTHAASDLGAGAPLTGSLGRAAGRNTGSYAIDQGSVTAAANANYLISFVPNALTITPRPLTISADNQAKLEGDANPALTASGAGFANGEGVGDLSGELLLATAAIDSSPLGSYAITPSGYSSTNYTIAYVDGVLTILSKTSFAASLTPAASEEACEDEPGSACVGPNAASPPPGYRIVDNSIGRP